MPGPLHGYRIVDLTSNVAGPLATQILGDQGADVIKVEAPDGDSTRHGANRRGGFTASFVSNNRNKRSIVLNLKEPAALDVLKRLAATADVFTQNYRPGVADRLGVGEDAIRAVKPDIVYVSTSGFGEKGPYAQAPAYDPVIQGFSGLATVQAGSDDVRPRLVRTILPDKLTAITASQAITAALLARERTGRGQEVDIAMLDSVVALLSYQAGIYFATGAAPQRMGNRHPTIVPYETFAASDGDFVIAVGNDDQWRRFCEVTGFEQHERFATNRLRVVNYGELRPLLGAALKAQTRAHWIEKLKGAGVPCGSVRDLHEVFTDPQIAAREMIAELDHLKAGALKLVGTPLKFSDTPAEIRTPPPTLGQHTEPILSTLGFTADEITAFRTERVI